MSEITKTIKIDELKFNELIVPNANQDLVQHIDFMQGYVFELALLGEPGFQAQVLQWDPAEKAKKHARLQLVRSIFTGVKDHEAVCGKIDDATKRLKQRKASNLNAIYSKVKPFERAVRSLALLFGNNRGAGIVRIFPVNPNDFSSSGSRGYAALKAKLLQQFNKFKMKETPLYITYAGSLKDKQVMQALAELALETRAIAILDVPEHRNYRKFLAFAKQLDITGISEKLGHLVLPCSQVYMKDIMDYEITEQEGLWVREATKPMALYTSTIMSGAMLALQPGEVLSGLEGVGLQGVDGPIMTYQLEKRDAAYLRSQGFVMIGDDGVLYGAGTANQSDRRELWHFPKVDIKNIIGKTLIQFANDKAYGKWNEDVEYELKQKIQDYLNPLISKGVIRGKVKGSKRFSRVNTVKYDERTNRAEIDVILVFNDVLEGITFRLEGTPRNLELTE